MRPTFEENVILSADLLAFFLPSELHPFWGQAVKPIYETFTTTTSERLIFAGFVPLLLSGWAVLRFRRRPLIRFWLLSTLFFFVLALGPYLHIMGQTVQAGDQPLPMPYLLLYKIVPFIGISRSLSRYDLMVMIGLALLSAVTLVRFRSPFNYLALGLICFEFLVVPFQMSQIDTPEFFYTLGRDQTDYNIAALPMNWDRPSPLLYQTVHHKGLLTAYTSRQNPLDLSWRTPVFQQWRALGDDIIAADLAAVAPTILHDFNVRYVILDYYQMPPGSEREGTEKWVMAALPNAAPVYDDGRLKVFESPPFNDRRSYLQLDEGWGPLETVASGQPGRWIEKEATLRLIGAEPIPTQLEISTVEPYDLVDMVVIANNSPVTLTVDANGLTATVDLPAQTTKIHLSPAEPLPISRLELISSP
jgi:hypothetical protein